LDCGSVYPEQLTELVRAEGCDLGVALDGDGDRAQFVDARGRILNGDHVMAALALHMHAQGTLNRDAVVATVMSNIGLELALTQAGLKLLRTDVGDRHVTARLRRDNLSLGGEQSGHIIFGAENHYTGDGVFTALKVLEMMTGTGKRLEELASVMKEYPQVLINVEVRQKPPFEEVPSIMEAVRDAEAELGGEGRVLLRYSGTERKARVMVEGRTVNEVKALAESIARVVTREMG
jgi:phosphoglucosamine mutase